jgi:hypothetical protein
MSSDMMSSVQELTFPRLATVLVPCVHSALASAAVTSSCSACQMNFALLHNNDTVVRLGGSRMTRVIRTAVHPRVHCACSAHTTTTHRLDHTHPPALLPSTQLECTSTLTRVKHLRLFTTYTDTDVTDVGWVANTSYDLVLTSSTPRL